MAGFCFLQYGLSIELRSIIHNNPLTPSGASATSALFHAALVRVRAPLFKEASLRAGFCFLLYGLSIELRSVSSPLHHLRDKRLVSSGGR
jgi:hypothetical protein